jgi:hypothetical protein
MDINNLTLEELKIVNDAIVQRINKLTENKENRNKFIIDDIAVYLTKNQAANLINELHDFVYKTTSDTKFD